MRRWHDETMNIRASFRPALARRRFCLAGWGCFRQDVGICSAWGFRSREGGQTEPRARKSWHWREGCVFRFSQHWRKIAFFVMAVSFEKGLFRFSLHSRVGGFSQEPALARKQIANSRGNNHILTASQKHPTNSRIKIPQLPEFLCFCTQNQTVMLSSICKPGNMALSR